MLCPWLIGFLQRSGPSPYYEEQMKFMVSGYGSETGTAQKPFRTMRLRSKPEQPVQVVKNSVSYGRDRKADALVVHCSTVKVNQQSTDNDVRLFIHDLSRKEAYRLAFQLISMVEPKGVDGENIQPPMSRERDWFFECLFGFFGPGISDADAVAILKMAEHLASWQEEDVEDIDQKHRLAARQALIREVLRTYDPAANCSPGRKVV